MELAGWRVGPYDGIAGQAMYAVYLSADLASRARAGEIGETELGFRLLDYLQSE